MDYLDKYRHWLDNLAEGDPLREELLSLGGYKGNDADGRISSETLAEPDGGSEAEFGNEADVDREIEDRFHADLSFGTAGLRGKVGAGTNRMNILTVGKASCGIGRFIRSFDGAAQRGVVIARDPRHMSEEFCKLTAGILAQMGIRVFVFDDIRPTPQLAFMIRRLGAVCGINITASHNPRDYNGYKVYWEDGCQVSSDIADGMSRFIDEIDIWKGIPDYDYDVLTESGMITVLDRAYDREYLDRIEALAIHDGDELDLKIPIVYTPLNGCGREPFSQMLEDRGFENWMMVPEQTEPDPDFSTVGYPNPEDSAAFALSEKYGAETGAELLIATDPDADRIAIEVRNSKGNYVPLNGNQTGYLLINYILEGRTDAEGASNDEGLADTEEPANAEGLAGDAKEPPTKGAMVRSIVTSPLSDVICRSYGVEMFETLTGFKNICGKIPWLEENGYEYIFGYEESIGYAPCADIRDKDGISTGMLLAEAAAYYRKQGKSLLDVLGDIYDKYGHFAEGSHTMILEGVSGKARIARMMEWLRSNMPEEFAGYKVEKVIDHIDGYEDIPPQNALRVYLEGGSLFAIRPSGTEPKLKMYFYSGGGSRDAAKKANDSIRDDVVEVLEEVNS